MHPTQAGKKFSKLIATGTICLTLAVGLFSCQRPTLSQQGYLQFGTLIDVTLITDGETQQDQLYTQIEELLIARHKQWHGWLDGDLKQFNRSLQQQPNGGTAIPGSLKTLIDESIKYYRISDGLFNPALGKLIAAWGFHESASMDAELIRQIQLDIPNMHHLEIKNNRAYSRNPHLQLDFGGIAKGLAIRQIANLLKQQNVHHFIINAGGDIYSLGQKFSRPWRVAIENPFDTGIIAGIDMESGNCIFTSGNYRRFYQDENQPRRHHIIDPISGKPSTEVSSATVIHEDPVIADVAATTLMLTAIPRLKDMAARFNIEHYLVISEQRQVYASESMLKRIDWIEPQDFTIHVL